MYKKNIVLIGMPGAGKSTIGVILAKNLAKGFIDTDVLIQIREQKTLQDILDENDYLHLRQIEEDVLMSVNLQHHIIATGGSAVYSAKAMEFLKQNGTVVYLDVSLDELRKRIKNFDTRGIAKAENQSFEEMMEERTRLYRKYADITIDCEQKNMETVCDMISTALTSSGS